MNKPIQWVQFFANNASNAPKTHNYIENVILIQRTISIETVKPKICDIEFYQNAKKYLLIWQKSIVQYYTGWEVSLPDE